MNAFINLLFRPWENICYAKDKYGVTLNNPEQAVFFSINPLKDKRADANVTAYRNFLCEFDKGSIEEQMQTIKSSGMPYSAITFSGKKSLHVIISLEEDLPHEDAYRALVARIYEKLPTVDTQNKNPSRFSRLPGGLRKVGEAVFEPQKLIELKGPVSMQALEAWLGPAKEVEESFVTPTTGSKILPMHATSFLFFGAPPGEWNVKLFRTAIALAKAGYTEEQAIEMLSKVDKPLDKSDKATVKSAYRRAHHASRNNITN